jgi:hypothetical protein
VNVVILSAGEASRMPNAPYGCKSLIELGEQTVLKWQLNSLPGESVTLVCKPRVSRMFDKYDVNVVGHEASDGPCYAMRAATIDGPTLVIFADTLFDYIPECKDESWIGVGIGKGGRVWEYAGPDGFVHRKHVPATRHLAVHCGIYYFHDPERLLEASFDQPRWDRMLNRYMIHNDRLIEGWLDVGDEDAYAAAADYLMGEE